MDKSDLILDKLNSMEKALRVENKTLSNKIDKLENKVDTVSEKQDMSWRAIQR